jgi:hypothetical protein
MVRKGLKMAEIEKPTDSIETGDGDDQVDGLPAIAAITLLINWTSVWFGNTII